MLVVKDLLVEINKKLILNKINFTLQKGEIFAVLGHNGSGKTTLLKTIIGLLPAKGEIIFNGENIINKPIDERSKLGIGYIMQEVPEYTGITVYVYVKNILQLYGKFDLQKIKYYFDLFGLDWEIYKDRNFDMHLSGGEKKKIEIITTFLMDKKLYLLDEIEASLDATSRKILADLIKSLSKEGKSFILVSHNEDIIKLAHKGILLCNGVIEKEGRISELLKKYSSFCVKCFNNFTN